VQLRNLLLHSFRQLLKLRLQLLRCQRQLLLRQTLTRRQRRLPCVSLLCS
jgi:hypothetical protein